LEHEMLTQDTDGQAAPRFWVIMDYEWQATAEGYHDRVSVYDSSDGDACEIKEYATEIYNTQGDHYTKEALEELSEIIKPDCVNESNLFDWIKNNVPGIDIFFEEKVAVIKPNTLFLTKSEAQQHLKNNRHHYSKQAHTYAMTAWRSPQVEQLYEVIEQTDWEKVKAEIAL